VICLWVWLALIGHAPSLTFPLDPVEVQALPSQPVVWSRRSTVLRPSAHPKGCGLLRLLTRLPFRFPRSGLYRQLRSLWPTDRVRPLLFHRLLASHTCPLVGSRSPYAGGFFTAAFSGSSPLPWPSLSLSTSAPSCSLCRANMSTLQACPEALLSLSKPRLELHPELVEGLATRGPSALERGLSKGFT